MSDNVREFLKEMTQSGKDMNGSYWIPKAVELLAEMDSQSSAPIPEQVAQASALEQYNACMKEGEEPDAIERLRFFCSLAMNGRDWLDSEHFFDAVATQSAKQGARPSAWISVDERLPAISEEVLIWCGYRICGYRSDDKNDPENHEGWVIDFDNGNAKAITHWMPLPAAPAMKSKRAASTEGERIDRASTAGAEGADHA